MPPDKRSSSIPSQTVVIFRGAIGMALGAAIGYGLYRLMLQYGFYALAIPGAIMGLGCGFTSRVYSPRLGLISGLAAIPLTLVSEWWHFPFMADDSLSYFLGHLTELKAGTWILGVLGVLLAAWFGLGRPPEPVFEK